ncbi:MAG: hypothetical protein EOO88_60660 [Pedobacter sp.]|nr:MAG: hypothetical protein EOO88_60660 [Pedobacter sp.]
MTSQKFEKDGDSKIIMVAFCHFAWDALVEIESLPAIKRILVQHGVVLIPSFFPIYDFILDQQKQHPDFQFALSYDDQPWTDAGIEMFSPSFYFFRDGQLVQKEHGWNRANFCRSARAAGYDVGNDCNLTP